MIIFHAIFTGHKHIITRGVISFKNTATGKHHRTVSTHSLCDMLLTLSAKLQWYMFEPDCNEPVINAHDLPRANLLDLHMHV